MTNIAEIGHNNPPILTPFEVIQNRIDDLYGEARLWLDGEVVTKQSQADALNTLAGYIRTAASEAEILRKSEVDPFDKAKAEIQARYNALIGETKAVTGKTVKALDAIKAALKPYLIALENQKLEAARIARLEAEKAQAEAIAKIRNADRSNLEEREAAEQLLSDANDLTKDADRLEKSKSHAKGDARATGLRTVWRVELADYREAAAWAYKNKKDEFSQFLIECATKQVRGGNRSEIQGFKIIEERTI